MLVLQKGQCMVTAVKLGLKSS